MSIDPQDEQLHKLEQLLLDRDSRMARQADKMLVLRKQATKASSEVARQKERIHVLEAESASLREGKALSDWKLASTKSRKWWRLGVAIGQVRSNLLRIFVLPIDIIRILAGSSDLPPKPRPVPAVAPGELLGGSALDPTDPVPGSTYSVTETAGKTESLSTALGEVSETSSQRMMPVIVAAPPVMSLAPPPVTTVKGLRVASIMDEMSHESFAAECSLVSFAPHNWREILERERPNLLVVESAWRGNSGSWEYKVGSYSYAESVGLPDLTALVAWCRTQGIPTVFWNKEDPIHFEKFKEAAALFDIVFTTDANTVDRYRGLPGLSDRVVDVLPFAAQPRIHNPVGAMRGRDPRPVFAGAYYRNRHHSRRDQLDLLLDAALPFDLLIYDRMGGAISDSFGFPERFHANIEGTLPYDEMVNVYRTQRLFLNVNSVSDSPTMFSRRVFELLATGTPVVSTSSLGVERMFGGIVEIVETEQEASTAIARLVEDDDWWLDRSVRGIESVFDGNTYGARLHTIARAAGLTVEPRNAKVSVVIMPGADVTIGAIEQTGVVDEVLSFGPVAGGGSGSNGTLRLITLEEPTDGDAEGVATAAVQVASNDWLAFVDSEADLRSLRSLTIATRITQAEIYTPAQSWADGHVFVPAPLAGAPSLVSKDFVKRTSWSPSSPDAERAMGARIYAVPIVDA